VPEESWNDYSMVLEDIWNKMLREIAKSIDGCSSDLRG
jgi:hypothetical protein